MRSLLLVVLLTVVLSGARPPLLPAKPGPATRATYHAMCSATYYPTTWPRACGRSWGLR